MPIGTSWAFKENKTMAEVMGAEVMGAEVVVERTFAPQGPIAPGTLVLAAGVGIGRVSQRCDCGRGVYEIAVAHIAGGVQTTGAMLFPLPEPLGPPYGSFQLIGGRA